MISSFFLKKLIPYLLGAVVFAAFGWAMYSWGQSSVEAEFIKKQQELVEDVIDNVSEGQKEFRKANPSRDVSISLGRLQQRQSRQ